MKNEDWKPSTEGLGRVVSSYKRYLSVFCTKTSRSLPKNTDTDGTVMLFSENPCETLTSFYVIKP